MKGFKSHINERARQIRYSGLLEARSHMRAMEILETLNPNKLGAGYFSVVFNSNDGGRLVVKLTDSGTDGAYYYLQLAQEIWMNNPHVPRVAALNPFEVGGGYICIMEELNFDGPTNDEVWRVDEWAQGPRHTIDPGHWRELMYGMMEWFEEEGQTDEDNPPNATYEAFKEVFPQMHELFRMMHDRDDIDMDSADIHGGNVGNRNGRTPVLVDPIGATYRRPYNSEFHNPAYD